MSDDVATRPADAGSAVPETVYTEREAMEARNRRAQFVWVFAAIAAVALVGYLALRPPEIALPGNSPNEVPQLIYRDAQRFHALWIRWTGIDWLLTFLAAGTAVSAAIKNAYSAKSDAVRSLSTLDLALMVLAVLTVLATTFDAKLHAGTLAEKYRAGDLILQDAEMDYAASAKDDTAKEALQRAWHRAQDILEGKPIMAIDDRSAPSRQGQSSRQAPAGTSPSPATSTSEQTRP